MEIRCYFKNGNMNKQLGAGVQYKECIETLTAYFGNPDFIKFEIYKDNGKDLLYRAGRE